MELAEIINKILLTYEISYPHGVLEILLDCFSSLPKYITAKWNLDQICTNKFRTM